ncbi:hypothetical protein SO694_0030604 [Aureococcus anophagefferens]|uniref:Uncharacterized protein n=2 Tax=Aureococcus anophagefferens TaxID=44056 RepID=A0ABR1FZL5_AURAN|nr:hypothetical protein AURANDRAFT_64331 [Aureococcus anophagefferens]EGB07816.1 hypothetical protein AURANDRAFT_64331 [Aureococcus anophagefferens]|eukprot:XP_009037199.1 hypothetical protein AURANDRAFT_64331 [Aureococcus anophagefferens]
MQAQLDDFGDAVAPLPPLQQAGVQYLDTTAIGEILDARIAPSVCNFVKKTAELNDLVFGGLQVGYTPNEKTTYESVCGKHLYTFPNQDYYDDKNNLVMMKPNCSMNEFCHIVHPARVFCGTNSPGQPGDWSLFNLLVGGPVFIERSNHPHKLYSVIPAFSLDGGMNPAAMHLDSNNHKNVAGGKGLLKVAWKFVPGLYRWPVRHHAAKSYDGLIGQTEFCEWCANEGYLLDIDGNFYVVCNYWKYRDTYAQLSECINRFGKLRDTPRGHRLDAFERFLGGCAAEVKHKGNLKHIPLFLITNMYVATDDKQMHTTEGGLEKKRMVLTTHERARNGIEVLYTLNQMCEIAKGNMPTVEKLDDDFLPDKALGPGGYMQRAPAANHKGKRCNYYKS